MKNALILALVYGLALCASGALARKQVSWDDVTWWDPNVDKIDDSATYLRRKFRQDVTDRTTGLSQAELAKRLAQIVADGKASGETWRMTKTKCFVAEMNEQSIDVSPLDWFPAIALWSRRGRPIWGVVLARAKEVNERILPAWVWEDWQAGNKDGTLRIWQDFDHSVPDWRVILSLGFPGMKRRLMSYAVKGDEYYDSLVIAMDAMLAGIGRFIEQGRKNLELFTNDNCHNCS